MYTKLTLRLDERLIRTAKSYAASTGKSLSQIVADYFDLLTRKTEEREVEATPLVRSLHGVLRGGPVDEEDYKRYLEAKHR